MKPEPRKLPPSIPAEIWETRWYCYHCDQHRTGQRELDIHVKSMHNVQFPENGVDYGDGLQTKRIIARRKEWEAKVEEFFIRELDSLRGADDFEFEVGEGSGLPPLGR